MIKSSLYLHREYHLQHGYFVPAHVRINDNKKNKNGRS